MASTAAAIAAWRAASAARDAVTLTRDERRAATLAGLHELLTQLLVALRTNMADFFIQRQRIGTYLAGLGRLPYTSNLQDADENATTADEFRLLVHAALGEVVRVMTPQPQYKRWALFRARWSRRFGGLGALWEKDRR